MEEFDFNDLELVSKRVTSPEAINRIAYVQKSLDEALKKQKTLFEKKSNSFQNIIVDLELQLTSVPLTQQLPLKPAITAHLEKYAFQSLSDVNNTYQQRVYVLQSRVNQWISEKLNQVEIVLDESDKPENTEALNIPSIGKYTGQIFSFFQDNRTGSYIGILESIFSGVVSIIGWAINSIADFFTSNEKLRKRDINSIVTKTKTSYQKIHNDFASALNGSITSICRRIEEKSLDRANVYLGDLRSQLNKLDTPLDRTANISFQKFVEDLKSIEQSIASNFIQLKDYTEGIDWEK